MTVNITEKKSCWSDREFIETYTHWTDNKFCFFFIKTETANTSIPCIQETNFVHPFKGSVPLNEPNLSAIPSDIRISFDRDISLLIYSCDLSLKFWKQYKGELVNFLEENGSLDLITDPLNNNWRENDGMEAWRLVLEYFLPTPHDQKTGVAYFKSDSIPVINYEYGPNIPILSSQKRLRRDKLARNLFKSLIKRQKDGKIDGKILWKIIF